MSEQEQIDNLTALLDRDGSGTISADTLTLILQRWDSASFSDQSVECLLTDWDGDRIDCCSFATWLVTGSRAKRSLSLPKAVASMGGISKWNSHSIDITMLQRMISAMCDAKNVEEALAEARAICSLGHPLWAFAYMRCLYNRNIDIFFATLAVKPQITMPMVYTPTVGEACQNYGKMPMGRRGCYLSIVERGRFKEVLQEYAEAELTKGADGKYLCDCIVFSDGGRILGLGDLGAWGMGIPIGKLDLYTVCAGVNPYRTIPVIIDAGCAGPEGNTDRLEIRDHPLYTGLKQPRATHMSAEGTVVNSAYYGEDSIIGEFMQGACELFGRTCLLQFEDFNSNDAFPLLAEYRDKYLCYNDDIQGTAAVALAGLLGAMKLQSPDASDLRSLLSKQTFFFHGAGSANLGTMKLLRDSGVPVSSIFATNANGLIWRSEDGSEGSFQMEDQKAFAVLGKPSFDTKDLVALVKHLRPSCVVAATGVCPNCFTKPFIEALTNLNAERPVVFALSNPKSQSEITAENAYNWSGGKVIFGSGTWFGPVTCDGKVHSPGQVNNVYIFPGVSFGAVCCQASSIPERLFLAAAEAVAHSLSEFELQTNMVMPRRRRIPEVSLNVATAVVLEAQAMGIAGRPLGDSREQIKAALADMRWLPQAS